MRNFVCRFSKYFVSDIFFANYLSGRLFCRTQQDVDPCLQSCMQELQASLGTIFLTRLATGSILKLAVPYIMQKMKTANETKGVDPDDLTDVELAYIQDVSNNRNTGGDFSAPLMSAGLDECLCHICVH